MFAFVRYIEDDVRAVVPASFIRDFSPETTKDFDRKKIYQIYWTESQHKLPEDKHKLKQHLVSSNNYYKGQILLLSDDEKDLKKQISSGKRIHVPKVNHDEEIEENQCFKNLDLEISAMKHSMQEQKRKTFQAQKQTMSKILEIKKKARKRNPLFREPKRTKKDYVEEIETSSSDDSDVDVVPSKLFKEMKEKYNVTEKKYEILKKQKRNMDEEMSLLRKENQTLNTENRTLRDLNIKLQSNLLSRFPRESEPTTSEKPIAVHECPASKESQYIPFDCIDGKVCIGEGIWLPEEKWRWISKASKDSIFCKELAVAVWGSEVLKDRSTEGKICNRFKQMGAVAKPPLTPARYQAVKNCFHQWLKEKSIVEDELKKRQSKIGQYISEKIMDVVRASRKEMMKNTQNFEQ